jgi:SAM-dependent methyltransferase
VASRLEEFRHGRRLLSTLEGLTRVHLLRTGIHLGLFEALRQPLSEVELAERLGLAADLTGATLRAAHAHGLLRRRGDTYEIGSFVRWLLDSPHAAALHALLDQAALGFGPRLESLDRLLKGSERPAFGTSDEALRTAAATRLVEGPALKALARVPGARAARRVLDVGCGFGTYLAGFLGRYRDAHGLGIELDPEVAEEARRRLREAEVSRRAEIRVGDFMTMDLPKGTYDLILLNHGLHYFPLSQRGALLRRARSRLSERGVLVIQTVTWTEQLGARWLGARSWVALLDLYYRAHRNLYGLPDVAEIRRELLDAGFGETGVVPVLPGGTVVYAWARP